MPLPGTIGFSRNETPCPTGPIVVSTPSVVPVACYYPAVSSTSISVPIQIDVTEKNYPVILYAHTRRVPICSSALPTGAGPSLLDISKDYTLVGYMLTHVVNRLAKVTPDWSAPLGVDTDQAAVLPVCRMC